MVLNKINRESQRTTTQLIYLNTFLDLFAKLQQITHKCCLAEETVQQQLIQQLLVQA